MPVCSTKCLEDPRVRSILVVGRQTCGIRHPKLRELLRTDFFDYRDALGQLAGYDASKTRLYQIFYDIFRPLYPLLKHLAPSHVTTTEHVGRAMIAVAADGYLRKILENRDINLLAEAAGQRDHPAP